MEQWQTPHRVTLARIQYFFLVNVIMTQHRTKWCYLKTCCIWYTFSMSDQEVLHWNSMSLIFLIIPNFFLQCRSQYQSESLSTARQSTQICGYGHMECCLSKTLTTEKYSSRASPTAHLPYVWHFPLKCSSINKALYLRAIQLSIWNVHKVTVILWIWALADGSRRSSFIP